MADNDKQKAATLADAMAHAEGLDVVPMVIICQGPPRCTLTFTDDAPPPTDCPWCARIRADDPRDPDKIIAEMKRTQS